MNSFENRLKKNLKTLVPWAQKFPCDAYRVYDRDIPEYAVSVDFYAGNIVVYRYLNQKFTERDDLRFPEVLDGIKSVFGVSDNQIFIKERERQKGLSQYQRVDQSGCRVDVHEGPLTLVVNLSDYLDTGLFLDHRASRRWVRENAAGLRVLNLFCYTGSVSAHAISGGARQVVSVDMSATYLDWAAENFARNQFSISQHPLIRADVLEWLRHLDSSEKFDLVFLDPPSFSNSKKMKQDFDVQQDHDWLIRLCMSHLSERGVLFFSNNLRSFKLDEKLCGQFSFSEITRKTLPPDFRNELIHRAWLVKHAHKF